MKVDLFKQVKNYTDRDGNERTGTYFFVRCGDVNVPIQATYFKNAAEGDKGYSSRKQLLSAFATKLPTNAQNTERSATKCPTCGGQMTLQHDEIDDNGKHIYYWLCKNCSSVTALSEDGSSVTV